MQEIIIKQVADLSQTEYRACYLANYGAEGYMREELFMSRRKPSERPGIAIMVWDGPKDSISSLKGWALLVPVRTWGLVAGTRYTKSKSKYTAQFWVKRQYRRKGLGKLLMAEVKKFDSRPHVFPHDDASGELFSSYEVTTSGMDRAFLRPGKAKIA